MSPTARVGAFMLVALIVLGVFVVKIEEIPIGAKGGRYQVQAVFPSVAGLDEKSPVRIAGVRVGLVERVELQGDRALVTLGLDNGVTLRRGARAAVTSLGMLGDKYVEIDPGPLDAPPLPAETVLDGTSPIAFDEVMRTVGDVGSDIKAVTGSLRQSLAGDEGQRRIDEILENIRQLSEDTRAMVAANRASVDDTVANFRAFSETLRNELPKLAEKLNALADRVDAVVADNKGNLTDSIANVKDLSGRLRTSADNLNEISGKIARGEGTIGKLVNDEETVDNLNATLKSVESGVTSLKNSIGRAERWRLDLNIRSEALPGLEGDDASRSALGLDLATSERRFFRLEFVDSPFGRRSQSTKTTTTTLPDGSSTTIVEETETVKDTFTFNAQVGYVFKNFTLRAGLFESTGGVGIDHTTLKNRLRLTFEAYDVNRDTKAPHLRLEGRYFFTENIFAYAGWDDPTWSERSTALIGGGVTWGDDDVKYLLGTAGSLAGN